MSREIKFRGEKTEGGKWVYGFYQEHPLAYCHIQNSSNDWFPVFADTVGQYIGVDDKNGKEIYEDDIVRTNSSRLCKVVWFSSPQYQGWDLEPIEAKNPHPKERELWKDLEVIGNVHENADLLKEVEENEVD